MDGTTQTGSGTQAQGAAADAATDQNNAGNPLEEFLADESNRAAYDAAVASAVEAAVEKQNAEAEEARRVAKLTAEERLGEKEKELADREARLQAAERKSAAIAALGEAGIPVGLAECLDYSSKEAYEQGLPAAMAAFQAAVEAGINDRLRGKGQAAAGDAAETAKALTGQVQTKVETFADIARENQVRR